MDGVTTTHSGRATPVVAASSDESTDNCDLGAEAPGEEMDTTTTATAATEDAVMGGPDADTATDKLATRYANLYSPADRYVCFPFSPPFHNLRDDRATRLLFFIPSLMSLSRHIARHLSLSMPLFFPSHALQSPFGWGSLFTFPLSMSSLPYTCFRIFWGRLNRTKAGFHSQLNRLPLPHDLHARRLADDRRTCRVHERRAPPGQARGIRYGGGHACCQDAARPWKRRL